MKKISYDEMIIGLLLKFGSIDINDIHILINLIGIENVSSINECDIGKYIKKNDDNRIEFNMDIVKEMYESMDDFYMTIENSCCEKLRKILDNMDVKEFVLRKVILLNNNINNSMFSSFQWFVLNSLYKSGNLIMIDDMTVLTKRGKLYLFLIENRKIIDEFSFMLSNNGYDSRLVETFLISQDIDIGIIDIKERILTLDNFLSFCDIYDINPCCVNTYVKIRKN